MIRLTIEKYIELFKLPKPGITKEDITGRSRNAPIAIAREVYGYLLNLQGMSHRQIGCQRCRINSGKK